MITGGTDNTPYARPMRIQLPNERGPIVCTRTRAALVLAIAFAAGATVTAWSIALCILR